MFAITSEELALLQFFFIMGFCVGFGFGPQIIRHYKNKKLAKK